MFLQNYTYFAIFCYVMLDDVAADLNALRPITGGAEAAARDEAAKNLELIPAN
jgi:hypothetical protein